MPWIIFGVAAAFSLLGIYLFMTAQAGAKKAKNHFYLVKGMTYEQVIAVLGEPAEKAESSFGTFCTWKPVKDEKKWKVAAIFKKGIAKNISAR